MVVGYACIGTNDLAKAKAFYEELMEPLGIKNFMDTARGHMFQGDQGVGLLVTLPLDEQPCHPGNGMTTGFICPSRKICDQIFAKALSMGCKDEGTMGLRGPDGPNALYIGYVREPEGNKLAFYRIGGPDE